MPSSRHHFKIPAFGVYAMERMKLVADVYLGKKARKRKSYEEVA